MNTNIRTKVVNDTNELIFKNKDLLVDNSADSDTTTVNNDVTVTIIQPKDTKYSIIVYIMEYRRSDEADIFEADTDEGHKETFKAAKGSIYLVVILDTTTNSTSTDYYRLNTSSRGKLTSDITIKFKMDSPATNPDAVITIVQTANQTIHVYTPQKSGGTDHTSTFTCPVGTTYEVEVVADKGYNAGIPNTKGGTFNSDMTINATAAVALQYTLTITQSEHQTITVTANGKTYTNTVSLPYGTRWTATIIPDTGYIAGKLNKTNGTITGDDTVYATTDAIISKFSISVGATTNQTYKLTIDGVAKPQTAEASSYSTNYNSHYTVEYIANTATAAYYYTASENVSGVVTSSVTIPPKSATVVLRYFTLNIPATTNQSYKLTLTTDATHGGSLPTYFEINTKVAQNLSVPYGTKYSIAYTADSGYNAGASKSGTVTSDTNITHNPATVATATVTIVQSANQTIHVYTPQKSGGTDHTSTFTCPVGTTYEAEVIAENGYTAGTLNVSGGGSI